MTDSVKIFDLYCQRMGIEYHYGRKEVLNLLDTSPTHSGLTPNIIYFLHEYRKIKGNENQTNTNISTLTFEGKFFLVVKADFDQAFYNEKNNLSESKYVENIEPLIDVFLGIRAYFGCSDLEFNAWEAVDITNFLDFNADGLMISYRITALSSFNSQTISAMNPDPYVTTLTENTSVFNLPFNATKVLFFDGETYLSSNFYTIVNNVLTTTTPRLSGAIITISKLK